MIRSTLVMFLLCVCSAYALPATTLRVWDWWSPAEGEKMTAYFRGVHETYTAANPDVDLRFQHIPFGPQYIQKIMASMAAKRPPDCLHASIIWANDLYERGVLMDLRPFLERTPEMADSVWLPAALRYGRDGKYIYGIPFEHDASTIVYNLDMFEKAGIPTDPDALSTWEDLRQAAIKLTRYDAAGQVVQAGFMVSAVDLSGNLPWMYANGGKFYMPDLRRTAFNDTPMLEAMQFMQDLQNKDKVSFPITSDRQDMQLFMQGKVAMFVGGTWSGHMIEENAPGLRFRMTSFPRGPHGTGRGGMTWTNMMCIPKGAKNPELAWKFIVYYCGMQNAMWKLTAVDRNSPLVASYDTPQWRDAVRDHPSLENVPAISEVGGLYPVVRFTEIDSVFQPLCQGVMLNTLKPADALSKAQAKIDDILAQYYQQLEESYR